MIRRHLTFANCVSLLALFVALGGTSYAVATNSIGTRQVKNNSIRSTDVRDGTLKSADVARGSLGGRAIKESSLASVPRAKTVGGKSAARLTVRCPAATQAHMGSCIELVPRQAQSYSFARSTCEGGNRRLPGPDELAGFVDFSSNPLAAGGELTNAILPSQSSTAPPSVITIVSSAGSIDTTPSTYEGRKPFRCVATPSNG